MCTYLYTFCGIHIYAQTHIKALINYIKGDLLYWIFVNKSIAYNNIRTYYVLRTIYNIYMFYHIEFSPI